MHSCAIPLLYEQANQVEAAMRILMKVIVESDNTGVVSEKEILRIEGGVDAAIEQTGLA